MSHDTIGQNVDDALETAREQIFKALEQLPSTPRRITFEEIQERQLIAVYEVAGDPFNLGMIGRVEKIEGGHVTVPGARWRDLNEADDEGDVVIVLLEEATFSEGGRVFSQGGRGYDAAVLPDGRVISGGAGQHIKDGQLPERGFPAEGVQGPSLQGVDLAPTGATLSGLGFPELTKRGDGSWCRTEWLGKPVAHTASEDLLHLRALTLRYPDWNPALAASMPALITSGELDDAPGGSILEHPWDDKLTATKAIRLWHLDLGGNRRRGVTSAFLLERVPGWKFATLRAAE